MKILIIGSSNTDMIIRVKSLPKAGETVLGGEFMVSQGGKGANQAVAAARLGGDITFICKTGDDNFGKESKLQFKEAGMDISLSLEDPGTPSGVALILVDDNAENCIAVASGANSTLQATDISDETILSSEYILLQLEIPISTVEDIVRRGKEMRKKVIINPAPANKLSDNTLNGLFLITPNQTEAEILTGVRVSDEASAQKAAQKMMKMGVQNVIITMNSLGAYYCSEVASVLIPSVKVNAVDTTAAGDVFNGALVVAIAEGMNMRDAIVFANKAASISVTRMGAQQSAPYRKEIYI